MSVTTPALEHPPTSEAPPVSVALGPPGALAAWGFGLLRTAAGLADPAIAARLIDRKDVVAVPEAAAGRQLWLSQFPSRSLAALIETGAVPVMAFLEDPLDGLSYLKRMSRCTTIEALRAQSAAATVNPILLGKDQVLIVRRGSAGPVRDLIAAMLDHLGIRLDAPKLASLHSSFAGRHDANLEDALTTHVKGYAPPGRHGDVLSADDAQVVAQVLQPLALLALQDNGAPIVWPRAVFLFGDRPNEPAPPATEVTGAARIIFYGPYLYLPAGSYQVRLVIGFSKEAQNTGFSVEVHNSAVVAKARMRPNAEGVYAAAFRMVHERFDEPLEVRIANEQGALFGKVALGWAEFMRDGSVPSAG